MVTSRGDTWFFRTADSTFVDTREADARPLVSATGGRTLGAVRMPMGSADMSSFLLQAKASGAKVTGLADAGSGRINGVRQASEFGLMAGGQELAGLLVYSTDIHGLGIRAYSRVVQDLSLFQVKTPAEPDGPWSSDKLLRTIPAGEAMWPASEGGCDLNRT